jgi:hypothetical protein
MPLQLSKGVSECQGLLWLNRRGGTSSFVAITRDLRIALIVHHPTGRVATAPVAGSRNTLSSKFELVISL